MYKHQNYLIILGLIIFLSACTSSQAKEIQTTPQQKLDLAFVEDISFSEVSSQEITLIAHGQLPDACSKIEKSEIKNVNEAIIVSIFTSQSMDSDCGPDPINFNQEVTIDLKDSNEKRYTIIVNGINATVDIPEREDLRINIPNTPTPAVDTPTIVTEEVQNSDQVDSQGKEQEIKPTPTETISSNAISTSVNTPTNTTTGQDNSEAESTQSNQVVQPTASPSEPAAQEEQCIDKAAFYADVTIPDNTVFKPGDSFEKIWRIRNEGTCTWNSSYALVYASGEIMSGSLSNPIPEVAPGDITEISVTLQAPSRWGQYTGNWQFQNDKGVRFGVGAGGHDYVWVQIFVDSPASAPSSNSTAEEPSESQAEQLSQSPEQNQAGCADERNDAYEQQVFGLINNARVSQGLNPLNQQPQLSNAAYSHSSDMACHDFVDHSGSDASSWYDRVAAQGYANYNTARENIYVGNPEFGGTPDGAFDWWMNSQVHRDNILNPDVDEIGIGYSYNSNSSYGGYYTVVFARP